MNTEHDATGACRLLVRLVALVAAFPTTVLTLSLLAAGTSAYCFTTRIELRTQRSDLINARKDYQQRWLQYLDEFGDDEDIVVVVEGLHRHRMQQALDAVADAIRQRPEAFDRLFYRADLRPLRPRALLYLDLAQIAQIQDNLKRMSLLLEFGTLGWQTLSLGSLLNEGRGLAARLEPGQPLTPEQEQFYTQLLAVTRAAADSVRDPDAYRTPWHTLLPPRAGGQEDLLAEPQYFFSQDGTLAFLLTRPRTEKGSFTGDRRSVEALRDILAVVRPRFPDLALGLTGLPVLENDEMVASQSDTKLASWLALAGVGVLYLAVFRGAYYPFLTLGTLVVGTAWAAGWLTLTVGHLNILSSAFAMMLIGLGDYGVLWVTSYEQERGGGSGVDAALRNTAARVGPGIVTAAATTALAFFAAMLADFQAVTELGWIAGCGVLLCAAATCTVLPAALKLCDRRAWAPRETIPIATQAAWLPALAGRPRRVLALGLALTGVLAFWAWHVSYDHNLLNLQARGLESVVWERKLIERTEGASWHALSYTADRAELLRRKARFEQLPEVGRVVEVASLIPEDQEGKIDRLRDVQRRLRKLPERGARIPHVRPDPEALTRDLVDLIGRLDPLTGEAGSALLADLRQSAVALVSHLSDTPVSLAAERLRRCDERLAEDLAEDLHRLRDVSHPSPITLADLPPDLRERHVGRSGKWLLRVFAKGCLWDYGPLEHFCQQIRTVDPEATGKPFGTLEGLRSMKEGFQWAGVYALGAIVLVLLADFRSLGHALIALVPLGLGLVCALGLMSLAGLPLNPANMIAFPLVLGVGVDNGVHVLHDYLARRREGRAYALSHTIGRGILVAALTTLLGFGMLMISRHRGLSGLGLVLSLGVGCCMLAALLVLPALLRVLSLRRAKPDGATPLPLEERAAA